MLISTEAVTSCSTYVEGVLFRARALLITCWLSTGMSLLDAWIPVIVPCFKLPGTVKEAISALTCLLQLGLEFWYSILLWYETDEVVEKTEDSLELWPWWDDNLSFGTTILISVSMLADDGVSLWNERALEEEIDDLFAIIPMSTNYLRWW